MKRSNLIDSMLCKYPSILIGLIIAAASVLPLAAPAMALPTISITKASSPSSKFVMAGGDATYSITVSNTATGLAVNDTAHKVNITDTLPSGFTYKSQTLPSGVTSTHRVGDRNLNWNISSIPPGGSITISFVASTTSSVNAAKYENSATAVFFNTATSTSSRSSTYNGGANTADDVTIVQPPNLTITNISSTSSIFPGQDATYQIKVANTGPGAATNVNVRDALPAGFTYKSQTMPSGVTSSHAGQNLNWNISTIPANSSITISFTASTVGAAVGKYDNDVNVDYYANGIPTKQTSAYSGNTSNTEDVTITPLSNLTVTNTSPTSSIPIGENATYNITVENKGGGAASNVKISDVLPTGFKYATEVSIVPTGTATASAVTSKPALGNTTLNWVISSIPANSSITISFTASTVGAVAAKYDNSVNVEYFTTGSSTKQTAAYNGTTSEAENVTLTPLSNLTVTNTSPTSSIPIGENATYNITVENKGNGAASNVKVIDVLPAGFKYGTEVGIVPTGTAAVSAVTSRPTLGSIAPEWNISTIPANSSITISFTASTVGMAKGKYDNPINIEYYETGSSIKKTGLYNGTTGTAEDVTLTPPPNLTVSNATLSGYIASGSTALYQITVNNPSEGKAYNTKITDALPTGFKYNRELAIITAGTVTPSATKSYVKPGLNDTTPTWENYDIAPGGKVTIYFTATGTIPSNATASQKFNNSVNVKYDSIPTRADTFTANYDGTSSTVDDVTVKPLPPNPSLGNATRSASALAFTPETFCSDKPGGDGIAGNITGIVNTYFQPALGSVAAGTKEINIASGDAKGIDKDIKAGDLLLIVQMQDATITSANDDSYGSGNTLNQGSGQSSMGNTGMYEYAVADSTVTYASGGTKLKLKKPLINSYISSAVTATSGQKRFQVVRVPQYASVTVLGTLYAEPWDGEVGGILAVDAFGKFDLNNQRMSVNSAGFRGGFGLQNGGFGAESTIVKRTSIYQMDSSGRVSVNATTGAPISITTARTAGSGKGEGTAGTPRFISTQALSNVDPIDGRPIWAGGALDNITEGYPGGDTGRGAPANAGGAGNYHNAGGGGGGNGGIGGQGGLSWSGGTSHVPFEAGGRPGSLSSVNNPVPWQIIMGGGGGGGDANNSPQGVPGGAGGGIVMLRAGEIVGSGQIFANGRDGDRGQYQGAPDGAGGAGAGGTVVIQSRNASSANLTIQANGGNGGSTERDDLYGATPHGPGGGGAGGVVLYNIPGATINASVSGGAPGQTAAPVTDGSYSAAKEQTRNPFGATAGSDGIKTAFTSSEDPFSSLNNVTDCSPKLTMTNTALTPKVEQGKIAKFKIKVTNTAKIGSAIDVTIDNPALATGFTYLKTDGIVLNSGTTTATVRTNASDPTPGSTKPAWGKFTIPPGGVVEISYQVQVARTVAVGDYDTNAHTSYPDPLRDASNPNKIIENSYDEKSSNDDNVEIIKRKFVEQVWDLSPTIRVVRR